LLAFGLLPAAVAARHDASSSDVKVEVQLAMTRQGVGGVHVELLDEGGKVVAIGSTDSEGELTFSQMSAGAYRLRASDPNLEDATTDTFRIESGKKSTTHTVRVRMRAGARVIGLQAPRTVRAKEPKVSPRAQKEFDAGAKALEQGNVAEAQTHFQKAITIEPQYARAYNHLGITHMRSGHPEKGREAFERAVALNGNSAEALLNLAKVRVGEKKDAEAETLLERAVAADPTNAEALTILANIELKENKYELAEANASKVHQFDHTRFAMAHWIAGRAYEIEHKDAEAIAEYTIFLKESPSGALAEKARASLKILRDQNYPD